MSSPRAKSSGAGGFACPAENYMKLVDFGQVKVVDGKQGSKSNSTKLYTIPGDSLPRPGGGRCGAGPEPGPDRQHRGHRPRLRCAQLPLRLADPRRGRGCSSWSGARAVGALGEELTMDFKLGSKSVNPWLLFQSSGGLFWREN